MNDIEGAMPRPEKDQPDQSQLKQRADLLRGQIRRAPRLATNYVILSGAEFVSKILSAIAFAYLARVLLPTVYGYLEFSIAIIFLFTLIVDSGLSAFGAREIAKDLGRLPRLLVHITSMRFLLAAVAFAALAIVITLINQPPEVKNLLLLFGLTLFGWPLMIQWVFQGQDKMHYVAFASLLRWSVFSAGVFILVRDLDQLWLVPAIEGTAILCATVFLFAVLRRTTGFPRSAFDWRFGLQTLRSALPIGASEIVWAIKIYFATIALGLVIGGDELGWFGAAHRVVIALHAFVWLYFYNLLPSISRTSLQPKKELQRLMRTSIQLTAWVAVLFGILGTAFAGLALTTLYGPQYDEAAKVFRILIWLIPLALMSGHYRYTLIGHDRQTLEFWCSVAGASVNIVLSLILIPAFGLLGGAWALVISEIVIWGMAHFFVRRTVTSIPFLPFIWKPLLAGIVMIGTLYVLVPVNFWLGGVLAVGIYLIIFLWLQPNLLSNLRSLSIRNRTV